MSSANLVNLSGQIPISKAEYYSIYDLYRRNYTTFTIGSFPRGRMFALSQLLPCQPREQVKAKFWYTLTVNFACTLPAFRSVNFPITFDMDRYINAGCIESVHHRVITSIGILIDVSRPYFDWEDPQRAVKNNLNVLFIMLITIIFLAIMAGISVGLYMIVPWWLGYSLLLFLVTCHLSRSLFSHPLIAERKYQHYEL